jgi:hypothetical protein
MKTNLAILTIALALWFSQGSRAQNLKSTDVPRILSYQGHITNADQAITGKHPITVRLYSDPDGKHKLWEDTYTTDVKDGIFSVLLGSQTALPSTERLNKPIWLGISVSGTDEMRPLSQFTTAPYALNVPDKSITKDKLSEDLQTMMTKPLGGQNKQTSYWSTAPDPYGCSSEVLGTSNPGGCDLVLVTFGSQVMRYKYTAAGNNILGGYSGNTMGSGAGNIIAGGGESGQINAIAASATTDFAVIGGGFGNDLDGGASFIGGGEDNSLVAEWAFIGGGYSNDLSGGTNGSNYSAILGGYNNDITGQYSAIVGGKDLAITGDNVLGFNGGGSGITFTGDQAFFLNDVDLHLENADNNGARKILFYEPNASGNNVSTFKAQGQSADINYILPSTIGTLNQVLSLVGVAGPTGTLGWADGAGVISWKLLGNAGTTAGTNFIGTTDDEDFEIHVFDGDATANRGTKRVMKYMPKAISPNLIGGFQGNDVNSLSIYGAFIGGGGHNGAENIVQGNYGVICGGGLNIAVEKASVVGGFANEATANYSFVGGGLGNESKSNYSTIGGGQSNIIHEDFTHATIGGGWGNEIFGEESTIGGGDFNINYNNGFAVIGGGHHNRANGKGSFIGGGGSFDHIPGDSSNLALGDYSIVVGGSSNIASGEFSFVGGGGEDPTLPLIYPIRPNKADGVHSIVVGGQKNQSLGEFSMIVGGKNNQSTANFATIVGGETNLVEGAHAIIGAGAENNILDEASPHSGILAGYDNNIDKAQYSFIGGGKSNLISTGSGWLSGVAIASGENNQATKNYAAIGGGLSNIASGISSTIPGGNNLKAESYSQTSLGAYNNAVGISIVDDFRGQQTVPSTSDATRIAHTNNALVSVGNGYVRPSTATRRENAFDVLNRGVSVVYGNLNNRGPDAPAFQDANNPSKDAGSVLFNTTADKAIYGASYQDNLLIAWGDVSNQVDLANNCIINSSFGVKNIVWDNPNARFTVTLNNAPSSRDLNTNTVITNASITATVSTDFEATSAHCHSITVSRINNNVFHVFIHDIQSDCDPVRVPFMFKVVGRRNGM